MLGNIKNSTTDKLRDTLLARLISLAAAQALI